MSPSVEPFNEAKYKALMDGLKCKEILLSDTFEATDYFRLEAEYYNSTSVSYHNTLKGKDVVSDIQYGTSKYCDEVKDGYPVLRLNELNDGFIESPQKYCHILSDEEFDKLRLKNGDVLVIRTNGNPNLVGRSAVVLEETEFAFASYLYRVIPNEKINSEILVAYLNGKYGRCEIDKNSVKGNQTNFSPAKFRDINIPDFGKDIQNTVKKVFHIAHQNRALADALYLNAEQFLLSELKLDGFATSSKEYSIKLLSETFKTKGRFDAEYYQPKYDKLLQVLSDFRCKKLGGNNGIVDIKKSIEPGSEAYRTQGIPFVRVSDINKFGISEPEICLSKDVVENTSSLYPQKNTILFSKDGSIGIAYKMEETAQIITSGALLHLTIKDAEDVLPDYLTLVLNSLAVQLQAERDSNGAIIKHWKPSEIEEVIIPILDNDTQKLIASKVQESFAYRRKSKELLKYAMSAVEIAIEKSEEEAVKWLKEKGVEC